MPLIAVLNEIYCKNMISRQAYVFALNATKSYPFMRPTDKADHGFHITRDNFLLRALIQRMYQCH
jgi:hypothetical protein